MNAATPTLSPPVRPVPPPCCAAASQAVAAVLADGGIALLESCEDDLWDETLEDQLEVEPWDKCV
jgi:hypothetical protein